ncbi:MAG: type II secretion system GspH family protein [Candidatus Omnitrophica bacterium]|jgi:prepilin-type N-terminal cleavage/methylation domain-containing protein|nr:type II secretion system GspH family protein [Candidatus Omnitrophota bacterium]
MQNKLVRGFTLIETIITMIVLSIVLIPFSVLTTNVIVKNTRSQAAATAVALAEGEMEWVTSLRFSAVVDEAAAFSSPFTAFTKEVVVDYVNSLAFDTPVIGPTDYKRVQIRVAHPLSDTITLTTLVANDW